MLCKWHCSTVKPAVNHFRNSLHCAATFRTRHCNLVNIRSVKFNCLCLFITGLFKKFLTTANRLHTSTVTLPDIQRCTPVTITADTPILNIFQPVAKTSLTDTFRYPVNCIIISNQIIFYSSHFDKP